MMWMGAGPITSPPAPGATKETRRVSWIFVGARGAPRAPPLPQVAAFADHHLQVVKKAAAGTVATGVKPLSKQDRIGELARMISGAEITEKAKAHAKTLIEKAAGE